MMYTAFLGKSVPEGAATHVFLAVAPEVKDVSGKYFVDCREEPYWVSVRRLAKGTAAVGWY